MSESIKPATDEEIARFRHNSANHVSRLIARIQSDAHKIEALKAERDKWKTERDSTFENAQRWRAKTERHEQMHANLIGACRALNKGIKRLRKGRDNAHKLIGMAGDTNAALRAEVEQYKQAFGECLLDLRNAEAEVERLKRQIAELEVFKAVTLCHLTPANYETVTTTESIAAWYDRPRAIRR